MSGQWYYSHDGVTHGPFSEEEIQNRVTQRLLVESDSVWPAGREQKDAAPAPAVFDFSQPPVSPVPDWLTDIAAAQTKGPLPGPAPSDEIPEWLEDLRLWVGLDLYTPAETEFTYDSTSTGETPDWLLSWLTPQAPKLPDQPQAPAPTVGPSVTVSAPPTAATPTVTAPKPANPLIEKTLDTSGFDLETGRILDPEKFRKWKQQLAQSSPAGQPALSNASLFEVFRKARTAVEAWVDDDVNRACIMNAEFKEIERKSEIQVILQKYANYGKAMQEKLLRHLEFMVENRRKYYKAIAALR